MPGGFASLLIVYVQLCLTVGALYLFRLENRALWLIALLAAIGFPLHHLLPPRWRIRFFLLLSLAGVVWVLGPADGAWLVGLGLALVGLCHLPLPYLARVLLVALAGLALGLLRGGAASVPWSDALWPILGSLFMFRMIVYLYDLRAEPPSLAHGASYFFLLPNVCFPLFPVIDYQRFRRTAYDQEPLRIYQTGVDWMLRGVVHLILYRLVYYHFTIPTTEVNDPAKLTQFLISNFLLYLRVSGQFHFVIGLLHLFGFNLPETNHRYLLSASFTDFWRRINIYWKDFMMKIFYYPVVLRLVGRSQTAAFAIATVVVFVVTWALHSYQWFWLRGSFPMTSADGLFWGLLGVLVVGNTLIEARRGRRRPLKRGSWSARALARRGLATAGTLLVLLVLWALWTADSPAAWAGLFSFSPTGVPPVTWLVPLLALLALAIAAAAEAWWSAARPKGAPAPRRAALRTGGVAALLCALAMPAVQGRIGAPAAELVQSLQESRLSRADAVTVERGYYENLLGVERFNARLWEVYRNQPNEWPSIRETAAARETGDFLRFALVPGTAIDFHDAPFSTNRWGMRDRDYSQEKPPGTTRIALLGSSHVMGSGVADAETFEALVERRRNEEAAGGGAWEILNFAVGGYSPLQHLELLPRVFAFNPDAVIYVAHVIDERWAVEHVLERIGAGIAPPAPDLQELLAEAGVGPGLSPIIAERRLRPYAARLLDWTYRAFVTRCREHGITPLWVFLPRIGEHEDATVDDLIRRAGAAGFDVVDLRTVYEGVPTEPLRVAEWDNHPNAAGNARVADALDRALRERGFLTPDDTTMDEKHDKDDKED